MSERRFMHADIQADHGEMLKYIAVLEKRLVQAEAAMVRRSGTSSWEEWIGVWDPTKETAVDATQRLFARADMAEKQRDSLLNALSAEQAEVYAYALEECGFPGMAGALRAYRDAAKEVGK